MRLLRERGDHKVLGNVNDMSVVFAILTFTGVLGRRVLSRICVCE